MDWGLGRDTKGTPLATEDPREICGNWGRSAKEEGPTGTQRDGAHMFCRLWRVSKSAIELEREPRCCDIYTQLNATCTDVENVLNTGNVFTPPLVGHVPHPTFVGNYAAHAPLR